MQVIILMVLLSCLAVGVKTKTNDPLELAQLILTFDDLEKVRRDPGGSGIRTSPELSESDTKKLEEHLKDNKCRVQLEVDCPRKKAENCDNRLNDVHSNCCYLINPLTLLDEEQEGSRLIANSPKVNAICITNKDWNTGQFECESHIKSDLATAPQCDTSKAHSINNVLTEGPIKIEYICNDKKKMRTLKVKPKKMENKCAPSFYRKISKQGCCMLKVDNGGTVKIVCTSNCQKQTEE